MRRLHGRARAEAARRLSVVARSRRQLQLESLEERRVLASPQPIDDLLSVVEGTVLTGPGYRDLVLSDQPVAYWTLDETGTTAFDIVGSRNGTLTGTIATGQNPGVVNSPGHSMDFDGSSGRIEVPFNAALNPVTFSLELWARVEGGANTHRSPLTSRFDGADSGGYIIYAGPANNWQFWTGRGTGGWDELPVNADAAVTNNEWQHIVATFEPTSGPDAGNTYTGIKRLYVNGVLVGEASQRYEPNPSKELRIGAGATGAPPNYFFNGSVDDVAIYNKVLTPQEIAEHYEAGARGRVGLLANDSDPDQHAIAIASAQGQPLVGGTATVNSALGVPITINSDGSFRYDPTGVAVIEQLSAGQVINDSFTYTLVDSNGETSATSATVTIQVTGTNDAPTATDDLALTNEDQPTVFAAEYFDRFAIDAAAGAAFTAAYPQWTSNNQQATATGGRLQLLEGEATVEWKGTLPDSDIYSISVDIGANTPSPGSYNVGLRIGQNNILFHPGYGTVPGAFRVEGPGNIGTTNMGFVPPMSSLHNVTVTVNRLTGTFTVTITNGADPSQTFTRTFVDQGAVNGPIYLRRSGQNNGPAIFDNFRIGSLTLLHNDSDPDAADGLTVTGYNTTSAQGAAVVVNADGTYSYDPRNAPALQALPAGAIVVDTFTYTISDGNGGSDTATVSVTVEGQNDAPVANDDTYTIGEDAVLSVSAAAANRLFANDSDVDAGDSFTVSAYQATSALGATVVVNADGSFTYNPGASALLQGLPPGASAVDTFTYTVRDSQGATDVATVRVTVTGANDPPVANPDVAATDEDTLISVGDVIVETFDIPAANPAEFEAAYPNFNFEAVTDGTVIVSGGRLELSGPAGNFTQLVVAQGRPGDLSVSVDLTSDGFPGNFNVGILIGQNAIVFHPGHSGGALRVDGPGGFGNQTMPWTPALNVMHRLQVDLDADTGVFTLKLIDGANPSNVYIRTFTNAASVGGDVGVRRNGPTAGRAIFDNLRIAWDSLLLNDTDSDAGTVLTVTGINGTAQLSGTSTLGAAVTVTPGGAYEYDPSNSPALQALQAGETVVDTFTYTITDNLGATSQTTVSITVTGNNDAPEVNVGQFTIDEGETVDLEPFVSIFDADAGETLTYEIDWGDGTIETGSVTITSSGAGQPTLGSLPLTHTYTDNGTFNGTITITDSQNESTTSPLVVTANSVAPTLSIDLAPDIGVPGMPLDFAFSATDPSPDDEAAGFTYIVNWGDGSPEVTLTDPAEATHVYTSLNTYTVTVIAIDKDGHESDPVTHEVVIQPLAVIDGSLHVGGTDDPDRILIYSAPVGVSVRYNNSNYQSPVGDRVIVYGNGGSDTITVNGSIIYDVEFYGGEGDDYLTGGPNNDLLDGGEGRDRLAGGNGDDTLLGGPGNDALSGGVGNDYLSGDEAIDPVGGIEIEPGVFTLPGDIYDTGDPGRDTLNGENGDDILVGGAGDDTLNGGNDDDVLLGGDDNDALDGAAGNDALFGGSGSDTLYGRAGDDVLIGGSDIDNIYGATGDDLLYGGDISEFLSDPVELAALLALWTSDQAGAAFSLELDAIDDGDSDTLHGEGGVDWYLMFLSSGDKFRLASEQKSGNNITEL